MSCRWHPDYRNRLPYHVPCNYLTIQFLRMIMGLVGLSACGNFHGGIHFMWRANKNISFLGDAETLSSPQDSVKFKRLFSRPSQAHFARLWIALHRLFIKRKGPHSLQKLSSMI